MTDEMLKKVIEGLEWCLFKPGCNGCPYRNDCDGGTKMEKDALALLKEQGKMIKYQSDRLDELLKAQEPVKPVFERQFMSDIEIYDCGKCGTSLGAKGIAKYCMNCGRAVKW